MAKVDQLQPPVKSALDSALLEATAAGLNPVVPPRGAYRSRADQAALFASRGSNPNPVAAPGTSLHEQGAAVDIHDANGQNDALEQILNKYGLYRPNPQGDPPHYQYHGPSEQDVLQQHGQDSAAQLLQAFGGGQPGPMEFHGRNVPPLPAGNPPVLPPVPDSFGAPQSAAPAVGPDSAARLLAAFGKTPDSITLPENNPQPAPPSRPAQHPEEVGTSGFLRNWYNAVFHSPDDSALTGLGNVLGYPVGVAAEGLRLGGPLRVLGGLYSAGASVINKTLEQVGAGLGMRPDINKERLNNEIADEFGTLGEAARQGYYSPGGQFFRPLKSLTGTEDRVSQVGDFVADFLAGGAIADVAGGPLFHGAAGLAKRAGASFLDTAEHLPLGVGDKLAAFRDTHVGPVATALRGELGQFGRGRNQIRAEFESLADQVRRKSAADPHPDGQFFSGIGLDGNLYDQAINHYVEAGTPAAFATDRGQVLNRAARLGLDTKFIRAMGDRVADFYERSGQRLVDGGVLDPAVYAQYKGFYTPRDYHIFASDPAVLEKVMERLRALGPEGEDSLKILQDRLDNPTAAPPSDFSPTGKVATSIPNRVVQTAAERAALVPETGFIGPGFQNIHFMATQIAKAETLQRLAANPLIAADAIRGQVAKAALDNLAERPAVPASLPRNPELIGQGKGDLAVANERLLAANENQGRVAAVANATARRVQAATDRLNDHVARGEPLQPEPPPAPSGELRPAGDLTPKQKQAAAVQQAADLLTQIRKERDTGVRSRADQVRIEKAAQQALKVEQDFYHAIPEVTGKPSEKSVTAQYQALQAQQGALYEKALAKHADALDQWQKDRDAYHLRTKQLSEQLANRHAEFQATQQVHGETVTERQAAEAQRDVAQRKIDRGRGKIPDVQHAVDAVEEYAQRLGQDFTPQEKIFLGQKWLDAAQRGQDIFHSKLPEVEIPKGAPEDVLHDMEVNHPADAIAQNPLLAAQSAITPEEAKARGFTTKPWTGKEYGAMDGKYGSVLVKQAIDGMIGPKKYELFLGNAGPMLEFLSRNYRFLRAYANPTTHVKVGIGQTFQAWAGATERGVSLLKHVDTYMAGQKELAAFRKTGKMTPLIEAFMQRDSPLRTGIFTPEERQLNSRIGVPQASLQNRLKTAITNPIVQRFIDIHMMPKMGLAKVLMEHDTSLMKGVQIPAGLPAEGLAKLRAEAAAAAAERAMGGMEEGAVRYPGQEDIEGLLKIGNRYGLAPFTAYPLHTMARFFELLHTRPSVLLRYPQLRSYLYSLAPDSAGERFKEGQVDYDELPIPGLSRGKTPLFYRAGHFIPGEDAAQDVDLSGGILGLPHGSLGALVDYLDQRKGYDRRSNTLREGVSPDILANEAMRKALYAQLPSAFGSGALRLYRSLHGEAPYQGTTRVENPAMPIAALLGTDTHYPEGKFERYGAGDIPTPLDSRVAFFNSVVDDMDRRPQSVKDYAGYLRGKDGKALQQLHQAAKMELTRMLGDRSITDDEAKPKIRAQAAFMRGIEQRAGQGPHLYDAAQ